MKEGEKRRSRQKERRQAAVWRLSSSLSQLKPAAQKIKQKKSKSVFLEQSFSDDKLPTRHLMSIFAPEFVFLHRRGSELMEFPKVFFFWGGGERKAAFVFPAVAHSRGRDPTSRGSGENILYEILK